MGTTHKQAVENNNRIHVQSQREQQPATQGRPDLRSAAQQAAYRKAQRGGGAVGAADLLALQRVVGNRTIGSQILHTDQRTAHVARASYKVGDAKVNIDYGNVVKHDNGAEQQKHIEQSFQTWTGKPAKDISNNVKALSGPQGRWLLYAIDLLMDNPLPALDKVAAVQQLITYAPGALQTPLAGYEASNPSFAYEDEVLRASGWMELALTANLKEPGKDEQRKLDKLYNRTAAASGTAASSTCPAVRPPSARLDEAKLRTDLGKLLRTYIAGQISAIGSKTIAEHNLPDVKVIADAVQAEALTFFAPYIGRSQTRAFQQSWVYSSNLASTKEPNAIPKDAKEAFLDNRARSRGAITGLLDAVHFDSRCDADEAVFSDIIQKLLAEKDIQANLDTILSWQSFTAATNESAKVTVNLQHSAGDDACMTRWSLVETLCHELMHVYVSQKFHDMSRNRQVITEGFPEVLGDQLYEHIRSLSGGKNSGYRKKFEYGLPPKACAGRDISPSRRGYKPAATDADQIRGIVGNNNFRAAFFLGRSSLAGLQPKLQSGAQMDPQAAGSELAADTMAKQVMTAGTGSSPTRAGLGLAKEQVQRQPQGQATQQTPRDKTLVEAAKKRLAVLEPKLAALEGRKLEIEAERLRVLAARRNLDEQAADPSMPTKVRAEEQNTAKLNRAPVDIAVNADAVTFNVKFQVRFEDPSMESRFGELQASMRSAVDQIWKQKLSGVFAGRTFTIVPSFALVSAKANRAKDYWLLTVRKVSTGAVAAYPGCSVNLPDPSLPTSFADPMCDGGIMSIPPAHIAKPDVLGHEILHLFGLIDRYMMITEVPPNKSPRKAATQKPKVTLLPVRETHGRPDPLGGQTGTVLSEDLGFLFDKFGVYKQEEARSTEGLYLLRREVMRLREIVELGYDPNSLIRYREDFKDKVIKDEENL